MAVERWIRLAAYQASRSIRARVGMYEQAAAWVDDRFPNITEQQRDAIATGAVDIFMESVRRREAQPSDPAVDPAFRETGLARPGRVMVTVEYTGPGGARRYRSYAVPVSDGMTMAELEAEAADVADADADSYPGWTTSGFIY